MPITNNPGQWLTAKRLRAHGAILVVCLWSVYLLNISTPGLRDRNGNFKGTDFLYFYTQGVLAAAHRGNDLYDMNSQAALAVARVPQAVGIRYLPLYPPQASILFAPLARLSYSRALATWWICSTILYGFCCYSIWRACPNLPGRGGTVALLAAGFPAFFHLIAWGQTSALALVCFTLAYFFLRGEREFLAGLALGCLIFKPQLGLAAAIVFVSTGAWKTLAGAVVSATAELLIGILYYGIDPLRRWIDVLRNTSDVLPLLEPKPYQTHSLRTFWSMLVPWNGVALSLYVLSGIAILGLTIACWKHGAPLVFRYSALLLASALVAPHLTVYDLVILAPAILLLADWLVGQVSTSLTGWMGVLLYLVYLLPLLGPLARWTHVQLSVIAMVTLVYMIWRIRREIAPATTAATT